MQEPQRLNLYKVVQKQLIQANGRTYLHRVIYAVRYSIKGSGKTHQVCKELLQENVRSVNEDKWEEPLSGLALFTGNYIINTLEGTESMIEKHFLLLQKDHIFRVTRIIIFLPHIIKRLFMGWTVTEVEPPELEKDDNAVTPYEHGRLVKACVTKLYLIAKYLNERSVTTSGYASAIESMNQSCKEHLPEEGLVASLLTSPLTISLQDFVNGQITVPKRKLYHECAWPCPPDFVPYHVLPRLKTERQTEDTEEVLETELSNELQTEDTEEVLKTEISNELQTEDTEKVLQTELNNELSMNCENFLTRR